MSLLVLLLLLPGAVRGAGAEVIVAEFTLSGRGDASETIQLRDAGALIRWERRAGDGDSLRASFGVSGAAQQTMLRVAHPGGEEATLAAVSGAAGQHAVLIRGVSAWGAGEHTLALLVGDASATAAVVRRVATVAVGGAVAAVDGPPQDLAHTFKEPERRPPALVSAAFTAAVLLPWVFLAGRLRDTPAASAGAPLSPAALVFLALVGVMLLVLVQFWRGGSLQTVMPRLLALGILAALVSTFEVKNRPS